MLIKSPVSAFFWWRMLTTHLYAELAENQHSQRTWQAYAESREATIVDMIAAFQNAFEPWRNTARTAYDEVSALEGILLNSAEIGIWLLGQRSGFAFKWDEQAPLGRLREGVMETRPALLKVADVGGRMMGPPKTLVARQAVRLGHGAL